MFDEGRLDFHRTDAVARDVKNVINASQDPEIAVVVTFGTVAGEVNVRSIGPFGEVRLYVGLADRPEQAQPREVVLRGPLVAPFHEGADGGWGGIEDRHAVPLTDAPEAILLGPVGRPFVHHAGRAVGERAIDEI